MVQTERSSRPSKKSSSTHSTHIHEAKSDESNSIATNIGAFNTPERNGTQMLKQYGQQLTKYEQQEILHYTDVYFLGLQSEKIQGVGLAGENNCGYDDERGDYKVKERDHIAYRYEVLGILGKGSFGQVVKCNDHKYDVLRAVKIIRNKRRFHQQALIEVQILEHLREKTLLWPNNTNTVNIYESFQFRGHLCITFPLHDISLYELIKRNNFQGMKMPMIKSFASQMLESLRFLRKLHVIHSDLKPENILLEQPQSSKIVVIDFGSSCFANEKIYTYIQSRFYRSPEVILGLPYDTMIDIWSLGCILAELFTGHPLFPGEDEVEQLACIMEMLGPPPESILENATRKNMFFDVENNPRNVKNSRGKSRLPGSRDLGFAIGCKDMLFVSFLESCLRWDKNRRLTPKELMQHPWMIAEISPPVEPISIS
ncbi:hypothetical protein M758_4G128500 [Ceratodon purpureus]|nr:hypothetical protein KC19_4G127400 [Ceratodon purpureus]KAG0619284.1 hypothetical protein M758_4G128500 [Ceratodon purpureus]